MRSAWFRLALVAAAVAAIAVCVQAQAQEEEGDNIVELTSDVADDGYRGGGRGRRPFLGLRKGKGFPRGGRGGPKGRLPLRPRGPAARPARPSYPQSQYSKPTYGSVNLKPSRGGLSGKYQYAQTAPQKPQRPTYQAPNPAYQAPKPAYQAPQQTYRAPQQSYQAPKQTYQAAPQKPSYQPTQYAQPSKPLAVSMPTLANLLYKYAAKSSKPFFASNPYTVFGRNTYGPMPKPSGYSAQHQQQQLSYSPAPAPTAPVYRPHYVPYTYSAPSYSASRGEKSYAAPAPRAPTCPAAGNFCYGKVAGHYTHPGSSACFIQCDAFGRGYAKGCSPGTFWKPVGKEPALWNMCS